MNNAFIILFCLIATLASTQTSGLLRSLIELSAFCTLVYWVWHRVTPK
ncbi:MAG: hypothetical protein ACRCUH_15415 [Shewanella sp.]